MIKRLTKRLRGMLLAFVDPKNDERKTGEEELAQKLREYIAEPGFAGDRSSRPLVLSVPQPCAKCGVETTVLLHPGQFCFECFLDLYPLRVVQEPCRWEKCCRSFAEGMLGAVLRKREETNRRS